MAFTHNKHDFVFGRSCTSQSLKVFGKLTGMLDQGGMLDMIYLNLAKAFSTQCPIKGSC